MDPDRAHLAIKAWIVAVLAIASASAMAPATGPRSRLLKVPKVYNALITSDIPLLPSRAETAATAAVGPVLLYSSQLPVLLQPQAGGTTPQSHLDKLSQLQNQLQREEVDQQRYQQQQQQQQLLPERLPQHILQSQAVQQQLFPERQQQPYPGKQVPVQQLWSDRLPAPPARQQQLLPEPIPASQPVHQQLWSDRLPAPPPARQQQLLPETSQPEHQQLFPERQQPYPTKQLQQQLWQERLPAPRQPHLIHENLPSTRLPVQQQLFPERQQLAASHHQQHLPSAHLTRQFGLPYQQKPAQYPQVDPRLQQKQLQLQAQQQKQLQLNQFVNQQKSEQDSSYLPHPEMNSYQPPPSVHIDAIKNNKPSNADIPDVPPPPLPVGKRLTSYSYSSPGLSPPPPTNHHVPYG